MLSWLPLLERQDPISDSNSSPYAKFLKGIMKHSRALDKQSELDEYDSGHCFAMAVDDSPLQECFLNLPAVMLQRPFPLRYNCIQDAQAVDQSLQQELIMDLQHHRLTLVALAMKLITYEAHPGG